MRNSLQMPVFEVPYTASKPSKQAPNTSKLTVQEMEKNSLGIDTVRIPELEITLCTDRCRAFLRSQPSVNIPVPVPKQSAVLRSEHAISDHPFCVRQPQLAATFGPRFARALGSLPIGEAVIELSTPALQLKEAN